MTSQPTTDMMSNQVDPTEHIEFGSLGNTNGSEAMERELTPLQRLLACKKRKDLSLPQNEPYDPSRCKWAPNNRGLPWGVHNHEIPWGYGPSPWERPPVCNYLPPYYYTFRPVVARFFWESFASNSIEQMKAFMEFCRIESDLQERWLDEDALRVFLATCKLEDFKREEYDCEIIQFFPTQSSQNRHMLVVCYVFCQYLYDNMYPPKDECHPFVMAFHEIYMRLNHRVDTTIESTQLANRFDARKLLESQM